MPIPLAAAYGVLALIVLANFAYLYRRRITFESGPERSQVPGVSVVIPARNEAGNLRRLLPSIRRQRGVEFEVIVVDDQSEDATAAVVEKFAAEAGDGSIRLIKSGDLPGGWTGKSYVLHNAAQAATGELLVFLDADTEFIDAEGLRQLARQYQSYKEPVVLTGFPEMRGGGQLLVSLVPFTIFGFLPWYLVQWSPRASLSALNGQCWMISSEQYERYHPHEHVRGHVLEDVEIGRYLKSEGLMPVMLDVRGALAVYMYDSFSEAWSGFQKNAYPLAGGTPLRALASISFFTFLFVVAPFLWPWTLAPAWGLKVLIDRYSGFPLWVSLCTPISYVSGLFLQIDSMITHLRGRAEWKGRRV